MLSLLWVISGIVDSPGPVSRMAAGFHHGITCASMGLLILLACGPLYDLSLDDMTELAMEDLVTRKDHDP